jgi:hypothetical protein
MMYKSFEKYFMPVGTGVLGVETTSAAAAVHGEYVCVRSCDIRRLMFAVSLLVASDTQNAVVEFNKRTAIGVSAGEVALGTLEIPDGSAVGSVIYKDINPVDFEPGQVLSLELITQATDGAAAAGAGYYAYESMDKADEATNESNMVASA